MSRSTEILVADDDPDIREVIALLLEAHGFHTIGASDGNEALRQIHSHPDVGLVLLDLMMPRLSGADMVRMLKGDAALRRIPVVILSGDNAAQELAAALGAEDCLRKPVDLESLLATVTKFVRP
jgi:CheY-like chemotaxis protein